MESQLNDLPDNVRKCLTDFVTTAKETLSTNLLSAVLFGSAAEGRLRATSDVNLILVLNDFNVAQINQLRETLRLAHAAINLNVMFLLATEITTASESFATKFSDILNRHRVLLGDDPFKELKVSKPATLQRLKQVIVNLLLRLRERYALVSLREEQLVPIIADVTGAIRVSATTILELEGKHDLHPKEALELFVQQLPAKNWPAILKNMSLAREERELKSGEAATTLLGLLDLLQAMQSHVQAMK